MPDASDKPAGPVASPCVGICCVDAKGVCIGCFRTLEELALWHTAADAEKLRIIDACRARQAARKIRD